jgi:hypothetical protein
LRRTKQGVAEAAKKGLYYYVNRRKAAGTSRDKNDPRAPSAQDWRDAAKTAKPTQENIFSLTEKNSTTQTAQSVNEDSSTSSAAAEQAILNRIMTAHIDLLRQFGPEKVMQAAEQVAYNVGDLSEIGGSEVAEWVKQVQQILGA